MTHEEIVEEIIKHADVLADMHPFKLLADGKHYIGKTGLVCNKDNVYEIDGHICNH